MNIKGEITKKEQEYLRRVSRHLLERTVEGEVKGNAVLNSLCVEILGKMERSGSA
jgi:uncharacterized membrane-anchored protein